MEQKRGEEGMEQRRKGEFRFQDSEIWRRGLGDGQSRSPTLFWTP